MPKGKLQLLPRNALRTLKRNPQYLTPVQMESLKASIRRDGFCSPILVRPIANRRYEVISGNHRFMAACELDMKMIPCVVSRMSDSSAKRLAINLNTIHGEPNAELLAPFLAELDLKCLAEIHIEDEMKKELMLFDESLAESLSQMTAPEKMNRDSPKHSNIVCKCRKCGTTHFKPQRK